MRRTALLDGDTFIFSAASASEEVIQWDDWNWTLHGNLSEAQALLDSEIDRVVEALEPDEVVVALSDELRYRPAIMPEYKSNRTKSRKPVTYDPLREYVRQTYRTYQKPYLEGDDVLGILATHPKVITGEKIIVAIDKDMRTIPGEHYNYATKERFSLTEEEADRFFHLQTLAGDPTDGYPGCPGFGFVTAGKLLDEGMVLEPVEKEITRGPRKGQVEIRWEPSRPGTPWEIIVSAYQSAGLTEDDALRNARVARICRHTDYDYKKNEVILWTP